MTMKDFRIYMRLGHRYVGFFMVGIMLVYSLSGMLLVFRDTDFLKSSKTVKQVGNQSWWEKFSQNPKNEKHRF